MIVAILILYAACCGVGGAAINDSKGRNAAEGFAWGFLLGIIGLIVVASRPVATPTPAAEWAVFEPGAVTWQCGCGSVQWAEAAACYNCGKERP